MKRNMDLIRALLLKVQQGDPNGEIEGFSEDEIKYHRSLAINANLLQGKVMADYSESTQIPAAVIIKDLTWEGHDFLDGIESDSNWEKVKRFLLDSGKQLTIDTIQAAIKQLFGVVIS